MGFRSRSARRLFLALGALLLTSELAHAQITSVWTGTTGVWGDAANWSTNPVFPDTTGYNATIGSGKAVTLDQNITINNFTLSGALSGGTGAGSPFALTVNQWNFTALSSLSGPVILNHVGNSDNNFWGTININAGATFNNLAGATFQMRDTVRIEGAGTINNAGSWIQQPGSAGAEWIYPTFNNQATGNVQVTNGTMRLFGGGTHDGSFNTTNGGLEFNGHHVFNAGSTVTSSDALGRYLIYGTADINGTWTPQNRTWVFGSTAVANFNTAYVATGELIIEHGGTVNINAASDINVRVHLENEGFPSRLNANADLTLHNFEIEGGFIGGTGTNAIQNVGTFTVLAGASYLQHDLDNSGTINLSAGDLRIDGVTLTNLAGGNYNIYNTAPTYLSTGVLDNYGTVTKVTGANQAEIEPLFNNHAGALVHVQAGVLNLRNPGVLEGTFQIDSGAALRFSGGNYELSGVNFTGAGQVNVNGGTATVTNAMNFGGGLWLSGGTLAGSGAITGSSLLMTGGTIARDLTVFGATNTLGSGTVTVADMFTLTNPTGKVLTLDATSGTGRIEGPGAFVNQGTVNKIGANAYGVGAAFTNEGTVNIQNGDLRLRAPGTHTHTGTFNITSPGRLVLAGGENIFDAASLITGNGALRVETGALGVLEGDGSNDYSGGTTIDSGGKLLITGTGTALGTGPVQVASGGILQISSAGNLLSGASANTTVASGGTLSILGDFDPTSLLTAASAGTLAIDVTGYTTALDMSAIGNGSMSLGSTTTGSITTAIDPGTGDVYRLGGGGGTLTLATAGILHGNAAVEIAGNGTVVLAAANTTLAGDTTLKAGGTLVLGHNSAVGPASTNELNIEGGTLQTTSAVTIANNTNITGDVRFTGNQNLRIGLSPTLITLDAGQHTITVDGPGTLTIGGRIQDGPPVGTVGGLVKDGAGTLVMTSVSSFSGGLTVREGTLSAGASAVLGSGPITIQQDAVLVSAQRNNVGAGQSITVQSGGILSLAADFVPIVSPTSTGIIALDTPGPFTSVLDQGDMGQTFLGTRTSVSYTSATLGAGSADAYRLGGGGGTLTITDKNVLTGDTSLVVGSLQPNGTGTVVLQRDQNYTGNTTVNPGSTLVLNGTLTGGGNVSVLLGGTLMGSGSLLASAPDPDEPVVIEISDGGLISPGNSPGSITTEGLFLREGSTYRWELGSLTELGAGTNFDQLTVTSLLAVNDHARLDLAFLAAGSSPVNGSAFWLSNRSWQIIDLASGGLNFYDTYDLDIDNSLWSSLGSFTTQAAADGGVNLVWEVAPVPEPSTYVLSVVGLAVVGWVARRKIRQKRLAQAA